MPLEEIHLLNVSVFRLAFRVSNFRGLSIGFFGF